VKGVTYRGGRWQVRKQVKGRRVAVSFTVKTDALEYLRNLERQGAGLPVLQKPVSLKQGREKYEEVLGERGSPPTTFRYYRAKFEVLERLIGAAVRLDSITQEDIGAFVKARREAGIGNRTIRAELDLLHRTSRRSGITPSWSVPYFRIPKQPRRSPPPEEVAKLWWELHGPAKVALGLTLLTGIRPSEAMRLDASQVNRKAKTIWIKDRKTVEPVLVALVPTLEELLPQKGPLVAASEDAVRSALVRASKKVGIPEWSGPGLGRHAFASWSVERGGFTTAQVADALGQVTPGIATPAYIHYQAVEPVRRPMSLLVEGILLEALKNVPPSGTKRVSRNRVSHWRG
jgi:integrase